MRGEPVSYYIYYRVAATHVDVARRAVAGVMAALEQRTSVAGRLLGRRDEPLVWMEVYESVREPARFEAALRELVEGSGIAACLAPGSERKIECFVPVQA